MSSFDPNVDPNLEPKADLTSLPPRTTSTWRDRLKRNPFSSEASKKTEKYTISAPIQRGSLQEQQLQAYEQKAQTTWRQRFAMGPFHFTILFILFFTLLVLLLGSCYASLLAHPDTGSSSDASSSSSSSSNSSANDLSNLFHRGSQIVKAPLATLEIGGPKFRIRSDAENTAAPGQPVAPSNSAMKHKLDQFLALTNLERHKTEVIVQLVFYTITLPLVTLAHTGIELMAMFLSASIRRKRSREGASMTAAARVADVESFSDVDSDAASLREEKFGFHEETAPPVYTPADPFATAATRNSSMHTAARLPPRPVSRTKMEKLYPYLPIISLVSSCLLLVGWLVWSSIQTRCELTHTKDKFPESVRDAPSICPVLVSAHLTPHTIGWSTAKVVFSWFIVAAYLTHIFLLIRSGELSPAARKFVQATRERVSQPPLPRSALRNSPRALSPVYNASSGISRTNSRGNRKTVRFEDDKIPVTDNMADNATTVSSLSDQYTPRTRSQSDISAVQSSLYTGQLAVADIQTFHKAPTHRPDYIRTDTNTNDALTTVSELPSELPSGDIIDYYKTSKAQFQPRNSLAKQWPMNFEHQVNREAGRVSNPASLRRGTSFDLPRYNFSWMHDQNVELSVDKHDEKEAEGESQVVPIAFNFNIARRGSVDTMRPTSRVERWIDRTDSYEKSKPATTASNTRANIRSRYNPLVAP